MKAGLTPSPGTLRWALERWLEAVVAKRSSRATVARYRYTGETYIQFLHATGRVAWNHDLTDQESQRPRGSGIQFLDIPETDRELLEDYITSLETYDGQFGGH